MFKVICDVERNFIISVQSSIILLQLRCMCDDKERCEASYWEDFVITTKFEFAHIEASYGVYYICYLSFNRLCGSVKGLKIRLPPTYQHNL